MISTDIRLGDVQRDLYNKTFTGEGVSKYYPKGSQKAYYRMSYSPAFLEIRHKSPWGPSEEKILVQYKSAEDMNFISIEFFLDGKRQNIIFEDSLEKLENPEEPLIKYLFLDPRVVLMSAEDVREIPIAEPGKCHQIVALDLSELPFGPKVVSEFFTNGLKLEKMRMRQFLGDKEILSQNMEILFSYNDLPR